MTSRPASGIQMAGMRKGAMVSETGENQPYVVADDVDCAGMIWAILGDEDPELEQELEDVVNGPSYPIGSLHESIDRSRERALEDRPPPKRGQWIEGHGWLQGNLIELGNRAGKGSVADDN